MLRCFFWSENILWKEDMQGHRLTVSLAGRDLIVDTDAVGRYLSKDQDGNWRNRIWKGQELDLLWFEELDHAQVFDSRRNREILVGVIKNYSLTDRPLSTGNNEG